MFNKKKRSDMGLTGLQGKVGKVGKVGKPGGLNINKLSDPEAQSQTVGLGRGLGIKTTTTAEPLGEQIDNFIEELTRAQASDSVRKSNLHVTKRATSNLKGTPRSTSRKGTTLSSASRVVSHPILPSGSRSSSTHPRAFDDTPSRVGDTGAESLNSRLRALRTPGGLDISTSGSNLSDGPLKDKRHHKAQSALSTGQLASGAKTHTQSEPERTDILFFTQKERLEIEEKVTAKIYNCTDHENCTDCKSIEYAYHESVIMAASIPPQERNKIIANNRCLRNIKNDLETLAENGAIVDADFDAIMRLLPNESSINGASKATAGIPAPTPTASMGNLSLNNQQQPPPAYHQATPPLPSRNNSSIPQGEVHRATALYAYHAAGDCNFDVGDEITVIKIVNDDWWIGRNLRTNSEGAFPKTYVQVITNPTPLGNATYNYGNEKASGYGGGYPGQVHQGYQQQGPPPPGPSNPYNR
ncbi:hypothetical protein B0O99DRAFT_255371 [Bisporella sp. PMI_857]|nr:hypothetical protein B0O99DRAFT_255371 [Bisporella sp. PMI_857]